jgi:hypothetical protein
MACSVQQSAATTIDTQTGASAGYSGKVKTVHTAFQYQTTPRLASSRSQPSL